MSAAETDALLCSLLEGGTGAIDYETYAKTGSRLEFERGYFRRRQALTVAALLFFRTGREDLLSRADGLISAVLSEPYWAHPAHLSGRCLPGREIDLFSAQTAFMLAELSAYLPLGAGRKEEIARALGERIVRPFEEGSFGWENAENNWLAVCMGNVAGTLYYADRGAFLRQRERLKEGLLRYLASLGGDGFCPEGMEYWNFGFGTFVWISALLFPELLCDPRAKAAATYPQHVFLTGNTVASFSDCPMSARADRALASFLAETYRIPPLTDEETYLRGEDCPYLWLSRTVKYGVSTAAERTREDGVFPAAAVSVFHGKNFSVAFKAGDNGQPHNHNDVGSFILSTARGQVFADLGQPLYDRDYFSDRRYETLAASSFGHSVPIVNGRGQSAGGRFRGVLSRDGLSAQIGGAYETCKKLVRTISLREKGIVLRDEFSPEDEIVERFVSPFPSVAAGIRTPLTPKISEAEWRDHGGTARKIFLIDYAVPKGATAAEFTIDVQDE